MTRELGSHCAGNTAIEETQIMSARKLGDSSPVLLDTRSPHSELALPAKRNQPEPRNQLILFAEARFFIRISSGLKASPCVESPAEFLTRTASGLKDSACSTPRA
jgi:hypothetical protein